MMKESHLDLAGSFKTLFLALLCASGIGIVQAWAGPSSSAPNCTTGNPGCDAPLHVGANAQTKGGTGVSSGILKIGGTGLPTPKTFLELGDTSGSTSGLLPPRVTTANRNGIAADGTANASLTGLLIYNTDNKRIEQFDGQYWTGVLGASIAGGTTTAPNGINLATGGCFAINGVCIGGSGGGGATVTPGVAIRSTLTDASGYKSFTSGSMTPILFNTTDFTATPPAQGGGSIANGVFTAPIAGQYLVTVNLEVGECVPSGSTPCEGPEQTASAGSPTDSIKVTFNVKKGSTVDKSFIVPLEIDTGYDVGFSQTRDTRLTSFYPKNASFTHLVDMTAGQQLSVDAIASRATFYALTNTGGSRSYMSVVRVGAPVSVNPTVYYPQNVQTGAIIFYDIASSCTSLPGGWTDYTALEGRYPVGVPSGGTVGGTAGTPLTNLQNRAAGQHVHNFTYVYTSQIDFDARDPGGYQVVSYAGNSATGGTTDSGTGLSAGTNAPYIQLRPCRKS